MNGHHAKLGGLLLHVFEVASIARTTAKAMNANVDLVVTGALLHDIGKVEAYDTKAADSPLRRAVCCWATSFWAA